jgi:sulfane dehydrogenase subunit SoxC
MEKWNAGPIIYDEKSRQMGDEMVQAEALHIARRSARDLDCDCKDGMFPRASFADRRTFLFAAGSLVVGGAPALAQTAKAPPGAIQFPVPDDPTKEQGRPVAADGGYGSRSQFETEVRVRFHDRE